MYRCLKSLLQLLRLTLGLLRLLDLGCLYWFPRTRHLLLWLGKLRLNLRRLLERINRLFKVWLWQTLELLPLL